MRENKKKVVENFKKGKRENDVILLRYGRCVIYVRTIKKKTGVKGRILTIGLRKGGTRLGCDGDLTFTHCLPFCIGRCQGRTVEKRHTQ